MKKHPPAVDRRRFLATSAASALAATVGCRAEPENSTPVTAERRDVPLRVALAGTDDDAASIARGWSAVSEQPLDIRIIEIERRDAGKLGGVVVDAAAKNDLLIYPLAAVPKVASDDLVVALDDKDIEQADKASGDLLPALRSGAARFAGQYYCLPLGAALPALLSSDDEVGDEGLESWEAYDTLVGESWQGAAGEPTAPGWAAAMYLWRTMQQKSWLFHREDLQPLVTSEPYLESLELMVRTCARYSAKSQTPEQVWNYVKSGDWKGGIGFPMVRSDSGGDFRIGNLPGVTSLSKVLLDPFCPVVSLTTNCRQSAVAKRFMTWISGGEGSQAVRQQVAGMTDVRGRSDSTGAATGSTTTGYDGWLESRLRSPVTQPTLQLLEAGRYYAVLDQQVSLALTGETEPESALTEVANQWHAITKEVGLEKQLRTWRRAQGVRG